MVENSVEASGGERERERARYRRVTLSHTSRYGVFWGFLAGGSPEFGQRTEPGRLCFWPPGAVGCHGRKTREIREKGEIIGSIQLRQRYKVNVNRSRK